MKQDEIIEGNKLIAEFMGRSYHFLEDLKYHSSWDWIMPVVDKIMNIDITLPPNWTGFGMEIVPRGYVRIKGLPMTPAIFSNVSIEGGLLNALWTAIVKFIKWHNENVHCLASSQIGNKKCGKGQ